MRSTPHARPRRRGGAAPAPPPPAAPSPTRRAAARPRAVGSGRGEDRRAAPAGRKAGGAKRYNEYVKTLLQLAGLVADADEKVALYSKAADLYVTKFANQAEAVKAYEAVLAIDPDNGQAVEYLRQMYEKRRDWEKLLGLQRREAERMPRGAAARRSSSRSPSSRPSA